MSRISCWMQQKETLADLSPSAPKQPYTTNNLGYEFFDYNTRSEKESSHSLPTKGFLLLGDNDGHYAKSSSNFITWSVLILTVSDDPGIYGHPKYFVSMATQVFCIYGHPSRDAHNTLPTSKLNRELNKSIRQSSMSTKFIKQAHFSYR
ncbi:hypothetical protein SARC_09079 [Sphaeroforma arctica JP610]|uniref:Uncharacterized protein n=1 Tax=Sphaeroforma arctica JP610 TaxID=667725 RepID=A0A0L0FP27_9EUKA|nr:hypothetical protein SARC_09079 [Sphaeroforma arctica JP610]KNC78494.1 hypothetical protein SARC_09079 [Sphaeroforma arctica JP610]|eukprot:XP_014152396.1 hypothetical protein SARC_09079 [Sphaeroforma arctica JP610]